MGQRLAVKFRLDILRRTAETKARGYLDECLAAGAVDGDYLLISQEDYLAIKQRYRGLGDAVAAVAQPIARVIDAALDTDLQNCRGCKRRQQRLNELTSPSGQRA